MTLRQEFHFVLIVEKELLFLFLSALDAARFHKELNVLNPITVSACVMGVRSI